MATYDDDLRLAHVLADAIERTAMESFGVLAPGTDVDEHGRLSCPAAHQLEELLRHQLQRTRPRDRVEGRWLEATGHGDRRWVLDAIDGVADYVRGVPSWATLLSLVVEDEPVLGLVAAPSLSRRWWAGRGSGAWTGRTLARAQQVRVSDTASLENASLSVDDPAPWMFGPHAGGFASLCDRVWRTRGLGDFWSQALVAEGALDVALGSHVDEPQLAALVPLVLEAGGIVTDVLGSPVVGRTDSGGRAVIVTNGRLHEAVLATVAPTGPLG